MRKSACTGAEAPRWRTLGLILLAVYLTMLVLHLQNFSSLSLLVRGEEDPLHWNNPAYQVDGEFILGTHDAYRWAAGAEGQGPAVREAPSRFLAGLSRITGLSAGTLAFWLPMFGAGLMAVVVALWAWSMGGVEAGLAAGLVAGLAPGFFYRSRLGYFDTDMVTLLGPLAVTLALAMWLRPGLFASLPEAWRALRERRARRTAQRDSATPEQPAPGASASRFWGWTGARSMLFMVVMGLAARYFGRWHPHVLTFLMTADGIALALVLVLGRNSESRAHSFWGLACFSLAGFFRWPFHGLALAVVAFKALPGARLPRPVRSVWPALAVALLVLGLVFAQSFMTRVERFTEAYSKPTVQSVQADIEAAGEGPLYPGVDQSIIESQNVDIEEMFFKMHAWVWPAVVGVICFAGLLLVRPRLVLLLPLLVLALMAWKYGTRTSMFGGPAVGLGLALPYCLAYAPGSPGQGKVPWSVLLAWSGLLVAGIILLQVADQLAWLVVDCWIFGLLASFAMTRLLDCGRPLFKFSVLSIAALAALVTLAAILLVLFRRGDNTVILHGFLAATMGMAVPYFWLANKRLGGARKGRTMRMGFLILLAVVLVIPYYRQYSRLAPTPVLAKYHALALKEFRNRSPEEAMVWTWWDWGYATNYYAHRNSFGDGARHGGEVILPLGLALSTTSPLQSRQIILFSAQYDYRPWDQWNQLTAQSLANFLNTLAEREVGYKSEQEQYLLLTMENVRLMPWIGYFGLWDVTTGTGEHPEVYRVPADEMEVNLDEGSLREISSGGIYSFQTLDILDWEGDDHREYTGTNNGMHLILVKPLGDIWLMGPKAYESMLVRMLICPDNDPEISSQFELTLDLFPLLRIWRVRQEPLPMTPERMID